MKVWICVNGSMSSPYKVPSPSRRTFKASATTEYTPGSASSRGVERPAPVPPPEFEGSSSSACASGNQRTGGEEGCPGLSPGGGRAPAPPAWESGQMKGGGESVPCPSPG